MKKKISPAVLLVIALVLFGVASRLDVALSAAFNVGGLLFLIMGVANLIAGAIKRKNNKK